MYDYNNLPPVLDVIDIKEFLKIGERQAYDLVNSNQFHVVRINRRIKVPRESFLNWFLGKSEKFTEEDL
jgi:hypothetical protein